VSDARSSAANYAAFNKKQYRDQTYRYMREKIRVISRARGKQALLPKHINRKVQRYSQAMGLLQQGKSSATLKIMGKKSQQRSEAILIASALLLQRDYQSVVALLTPLIRLYPGENSIILPLVNAYLGLGKTQQAWQLINTVMLSEQSSLTYFEVRQRAARQFGLIGSAYRAVAERNFRIGAYQHVITQTYQAMKSTTISVVELQALQLLLRKAIKAQKTKDK
jgi:predicted Zn-dependent protease